MKNPPQNPSHLNLSVLGLLSSSGVGSTLYPNNSSRDLGVRLARLVAEDQEKRVQDLLNDLS